MNKRATFPTWASIRIAALFLIFSGVANAAPAHYTVAESVIRGARDRLADVQEWHQSGYLSHRNVHDFEHLQEALIDAARSYRAQPSHRNAKEMSDLRSEMRISFWRNKLISHRILLQKETERGHLSRYQAHDLQSELDVIDAILVVEQRKSKVVSTSVANQISARFSRFDRNLKRAHND